MGKQHQAVKFKDIAEKLSELEGKNLEEIAGVLGYRNLESCRVNFYDLRWNKRLNFEVEKGVYTKFELLDNSIKEELEDKKLSEHGWFLQSLDYYKVAKNAFEIAEDKTVKAETRQKAERDILDAMKHIPKKHRVILYDMMEG